MASETGHDLCARLSGLIEKVLGREQEIIAELEPQLPSLPSIQALLAALTALDSRIEKLGTKVSEKEDQLAQLTDEQEALEALARMKEGAERSLERRWKKFRAKACADAVRALWPAAERELGESRRCRECGAGLVVAKPYVPETVRCAYCGSVTQVLVTDAVSAYYSYGPDMLAEEACLPLRHEIEDRLAGYQTEVPETSAGRVAALQPIGALESRYWKGFCEARASVLGEPPDYRLHDARLEAFERAFLHDEPAWRAPRRRA